MSEDDYAPTMDAVANAAVESGYFDHAEIDRALAAEKAKWKAEAFREAARHYAENPDLVWSPWSLAGEQG